MIFGIEMKNIFVLILILFGCFSVQAQPAQCVDYRGIPVVVVPDRNLPDVAMAKLLPNGAPVIYFNPIALNRLSPITQQWLFGHECGHHALGHYARQNHNTAEQEADCFGIRWLASTGTLTPQGLRQIQYEIAHFPGDWTHLPGPVRAQNLARCLQQ